MSIKVKTPVELIDRVAQCRGGDAGHPPPFTLVLGSGFSYGIIPTTAEIVRADLPWWKWCQRGEAGGPEPGHYVGRQDFDAAKKSKEAKQFWEKVTKAYRGDGRSVFGLDADGLPAGEGVGDAYRFALSSECGPGLHSHAMVRSYFGDIIRRAGRRMNAAHLYLAALIAERPRLFGTIFTTNFDPLLQRSLQLVNAPYYVSDRPDTMEYVEDDGVVEGVHIVHAHGSIYRYLLLNTPKQIKEYAARNRSKLEQYFRRHAVLIVGYSGWDDAITRALAGVERFEHNLYWTGRANNPEESDLSAAAKKLLRNRDDAFYVPITGADALMVELHQHLIEHSLPKVFREPILVAREQLDLCDLAGVKLPRTASRSASAPIPGSDGGRTDPLSAAGTAEALDLGDEVKGVQKRLDDAQDLFTGKTSTDPEAVLTAEIRRRFAVGSDHYFSKRYGEALQEFEFVVRNREYLDPTERAMALFRRGRCYGMRGEAGDAEREIADYTAVIDAPDAPAEPLAKARRNRGGSYALRGEAGDAERAIADCTAVIEMADAPAEPLAGARNNRGVLYGMRGGAGDAEREIADYTAVIDMPDAPAEERVLALVNRGVAYGERGGAGDVEREIADYTAVIDDPDASADQRARTRVNRGVVHGERGEAERGIADFTAVIDDPDAPADQRAMARYNRGVTYGERGEAYRALADYTTVIDDPDAPAEQKVKATRLRDELLGQQQPPAPEPAAPPKRRPSKKRSGGKKADPPAEPDPTADPPP